VVAVRERLEAVVQSLDPEVLDASLATQLVGEFTTLEKLCGAGKALAARRVAASGAWRRSGERSAARWLARTTGSSVGEAAGALDTAEALCDLPATDHAFRSGQLSQTQAREIASAASVDRHAEAELVRTAQVEGVAGLRQACRQALAAASSDEEERYQAIRRSRYLRHWSDKGGRCPGGHGPGQRGLYQALEAGSHHAHTGGPLGLGPGATPAPARCARSSGRCRCRWPRLGP
jgi:hypothetical protein